MPTNSRHKNIADTVVTQIVTLGLTDYPNGNVIGASRVLCRWGVDIDPVQCPAIFVMPVGTEQAVGGTNERDDIAYPIGIGFVDRQSIDNADYLDHLLYQRELIRKEFIAQRLSTYAWNCQYEPSPVLDERLLDGYKLLAAPLYFRFISRESRG